MTLFSYTPTQLRLGLACPRAHYFDAEWSRRHGRRRITQLWQEGSVPAGGAVFHRAVSQFARAPATTAAISDALARARSASELHERMARYFSAEVFHPGQLASRPVEAQKAFVGAVQTYLMEIARSAMRGREVGETPAAIAGRIFGDGSQDVDVTFQLGDGTGARVAGPIDCGFFDWRTGRQRILDFRLAPDSDAAGDLVQASTTALVHQRQHDTRPDVAIHYVRSGRKVERSWDETEKARVDVFDHLSSLVAWETYDETTRTGLLPPGRPDRCAGCRWRDQCEQRLGPKKAGERARGWTDRFASGDTREPDVSVQRPPRAAPELDIADESDEPLTIPDLAPPGLWVGMRDERPIVASAEILNTHVAVVGAAGSGKTWTAKIIAEEAIRSGAPVLAIDPQGDLVQFLRRRDESSIDPALRPAYRDFWARVEPRIFTPGSSHARRLSLSPIRLPTPEELAEIERPERRDEEKTGFFQAVAANLAGLAGLRGDRAVGETFLYQLLLGLARQREVTLQNVIEAIRDPEVVGIDEPERFVKPNTRKNLELALNSFVEGPSSALLSGGEPLDLDAMVTPNTPGRVPLNVIYLNAMAHDQHKQFFVAALATEVYRWMTTRLTAAGGRTNLLFYVDEARDFIPPGTSQTASKEPLLRLFRQGRKYGVACLVCTQSPRSVDYNAFSNCSTKLIGRLEAAQDVDRVKEWFTEGAPPAWLNGRKGAAKGSFVARWAVGDDGGVEFRGRQLFSVHEGAWSPDRVEKEFHAG